MNWMPVSLIRVTVSSNWVTSGNIGIHPVLFASVTHGHRETFVSVAAGAVRDALCALGAGDLWHVVVTAIGAGGLAVAVDGQAAVVHGGSDRAGTVHAIRAAHRDLALAVIDPVLQAQRLARAAILDAGASTPIAIEEVCR